MLKGRGIGLGFARRVIHGEGNFKTSTPPRRRMNLNVSAGLIHDAINGRKTEAGTLANGFGREERLEDLRARLFVHAGAVVRNFQNNPKGIRRGAIFWMMGGGLIARGDGEAPAAGHSVTGIDGEIGDNLLDLTGVRVNPRVGSRVMIGQFNVRAEEARQHKLDFGEGRMQIHGAKFDDLIAAESEKLLGDGGGFGRGALDLIEIEASIRFGGKRALEKLG